MNIKETEDGFQIHLFKAEATRMEKTAALLGKIARLEEDDEVVAKLKEAEKVLLSAVLKYQ